ncbi:TPA: hypothetical protein ACKOGX_000945, partial [Clostridioides difficile]
YMKLKKYKVDVFSKEIDNFTSINTKLLEEDEYYFDNREYLNLTNNENEFLELKTNEMLSTLNFLIKEGRQELYNLISTEEALALCEIFQKERFYYDYTSRNLLKLLAFDKIEEASKLSKYVGIYDVNFEDLAIRISKMSHIYVYIIFYCIRQFWLEFDPNIPIRLQNTKYIKPEVARIFNTKYLKEQY